MLTDSLVTTYSAIVNPSIDGYTVLMVATVISGLVIAGYNIIAGISIYRKETEARK